MILYNHHHYRHHDVLILVLVFLLVTILLEQQTVSANVRITNEMIMSTTLEEFLEADYNAAYGEPIQDPPLGIVIEEEDQEDQDDEEEQCDIEREQQQQERRNQPVVADQFDSGLPGFYHGVASGDPLHDAIVLWTRYTPISYDETIELELRIAKVDDNDSTSSVSMDDLLTPETNPNLRQVTDIIVDNTTDFIAKLDITGLQSGSSYVYVFIGPNSDDTTSPVGLTKTAPSEQDDIDSMTYAVVSCAVYTNGYFHAYDVASTVQDLDLVIHMGDYIYEYGVESSYASDSKDREDLLRPYGETITLQDYRLRYSTYRLDEGLQNLHRRVPMIAIWDDHEIADNAYGNPNEGYGAKNHDPNTTCTESSFGLGGQQECTCSEGTSVERFTNAATAYMEWMPIRRKPSGATTTTTTTTAGGVDTTSLTQVIEWGNLATIVVFDSRVTKRSKDPTLASVFSDFASFAATNTNISSYSDPTSPVKHELDQLATSVKSKMYDPSYTMISTESMELLNERFTNSKLVHNKPWQIFGSSTLMGPNVLPDPNTMWQYAPTQFQDEIKSYMDDLIAGPAGLFLRIVTAMSVTGTQYNRDDWNGFAHQRDMILKQFKTNSNNPIVLGGDLHDSWGWILYDENNNSNSNATDDSTTAATSQQKQKQPVAVNLGAPGVTSPGVGKDLIGILEPFNLLLESIDAAYLIIQESFKAANSPALVKAEIRHKGFIAVKATKEIHTAEYYYISTDDILKDYATARKDNDGRITSNYFCLDRLVTYADQPGSLEKFDDCSTIPFDAARPAEWDIPVLRQEEGSTSTSGGKYPMWWKIALGVSMASFFLFL